MNWFSTPVAARRRKPITLTLSPEALTLLENLAIAARISRSLLIEGLVKAAVAVTTPKGNR